MKTRLALVLLLVAAAIVAVVLLRFPMRQPARPPTPRPPARPAPEAPSPTQVVTAYLQALEKKDFRAAYSGLSADSRQAHPYEDFVRLAEKSGVPNYELSAAREEAGEGDRVTVTVPLAEDVAEASFITVREGGTWKVVYIAGVPSFPYPQADENSAEAGRDAAARGRGIAPGERR